MSASYVRSLLPQASRPSRLGACAIGLSNIGTLAGLIIAARLTTYRRGIRPKKAWTFALATSGVFCGLLLVSALATFLLL